MNKDSRVARRYATALFDVGVRDNTVEVIEQDLLLVERFVAEVRYLRAVLMQPLVSEAQKLQVLSDAFGDRITATTLNFLYLLVRKRRETLLDECISEYRRLADALARRITAYVRSAVPLSETQTEALQAALQARTGKNIALVLQVDPALGGGLLVRMGDQVIDDTVQTRMLRVRQQLMRSV